MPKVTFVDLQQLALIKKTLRDTQTHTHHLNQNHTKSISLVRQINGAHLNRSQINYNLISRNHTYWWPIVIIPKWALAAQQQHRVKKSTKRTSVSPITKRNGIDGKNQKRKKIEKQLELYRPNLAIKYGI